MTAFSIQVSRTKGRYLGVITPHRYLPRYSRKGSAHWMSGLVLPDRVETLIDGIVESEFGMFEYVATC